MIVQVYSCPSDGGVVAVIHGNPQNEVVVEEGAELLYQIQASTWEACMRIHYKKQGWEPYVPMSDHEHVGQKEVVTVRGLGKKEEP